MTGKIKYQFTAQMWQHDSPGGWYFVSVPQDLAKEIRNNLQWQEEGWGRMKAIAQIETTSWDTAIWFDTKKNTYILPVKAEIRRKTALETNQDIAIILWV